MTIDRIKNVISLESRLKCCGKNISLTSFGHSVNNLVTEKPRGCKILVIKKDFSF